MIIIYNKENIYDNLYNMLKKISLYKIKKGGLNSRNNFPDHRGAVFGLVKPRYKQTIQLSFYSKKHPEIYEEINRIGKIICPFEYKSIQVNHNLVCTPHKDKKNSTRSILVSFGEYNGGKIVIEGNEYNAYHTPIEFDGKTLEHWNTPIEPLEGICNKYSLVFFS